MSQKASARESEDTATIPVGTSSSGFPFRLLLVPPTRLPLIILSGDLLCATHTRQRKLAEQERESCTVANVNAGITVFITVSLSLPP